MTRENSPHHVPSRVHSDVPGLDDRLGLGVEYLLEVVQHLGAPQPWRRLLRESKFLLGLGDPLLGPSAVDAVAAGCAYIDPVYAAAKQGVYWSQHPFLRTAPPPYYCAAALDDPKQFAACARNASDGADLPPFLPPELTRAAHRRRVAAIFAPFLDAH